LNAATGVQEWNYSAGGGYESSPAVVNGVVYVVSIGGSLFALNAASGIKLWSYTPVSIQVGNYTPVGVIFDSSPSIVNGVVYVGSDSDPAQGLDAHVYALDALSGEELWNYTTDGAVVSCPAVVDGVVYFGSEDGYSVYA